MNVQTAQQEGTGKKFWQSSNFWTDIIMILAIVFVGFPQEAGIGGVAAIFGILAAGKAVREYLATGPKPAWKEALKNSNFWNYLATAAVAIVPGLPPEIFNSTEEITKNLIDENWQGAIVAAFSLITILYNVFKKSSSESGALPKS